MSGYDPLLELTEEVPAEAGARPRLLKPAGSKPTRCYCPPDRCDAPVIMGRQTPCLRAQRREEAKPVEVTIFCPECSLPHVDEGEWATTRRHKTHQCQGCGHEWRPFPFATVGVSHPTTPPAPEAEKLRVALRKIAYGDGGIGTHRAIALAALQQEGK